MKKNVGNIDRLLRAIIGTIVVTLGLLNKNWILDLVGFIVLLSGVFGRCPLYSIFGLNTAKAKKTSKTVAKKNKSKKK